MKNLLQKLTKALTNAFVYAASDTDSTCYEVDVHPQNRTIVIRREDTNCYSLFDVEAEAYSLTQSLDGYTPILTCSIWYLNATSIISFFATALRENYKDEFFVEYDN